jgi:hypothetical protein
MKYKKGFEIQFNWLFILVAGAAIILFFSTIIMKQKDVTSSSVSAQVLKSIESIISGTSVSLDTANIVEVPKAKINFNCGSISSGKISRQFQNLVLFSPKYVSQAKIYTRTYSLNIPFRTTNLLMLTSSDIRYIIIGNGDDEVVKQINSSFDESLTKEQYDTLPQLKNENDRIKFIFSNTQIPTLPTVFSKLPDEDVTAVRIIGDTKKGQLEFYSKKGTSWQKNSDSFYIGNSLFGALYSDSALYNCSMNNALVRSKIVGDVYSDRTSNLIGYSNDCDQIYQDAISIFEQLDGITISNQNIDVVSNLVLDIEDLNKEAQLKSCPSIY